ncbi:hypothetical protein [Chitinophaga arvensicola]|uniref:Uncharacterized protein n=1 Tax=Chitinophaga arvensicola TaxID=29529 RepID=A0A1I0S4K4_9BACT|nr:hypothetical protein [Chitinophaga arvensicola]SEW49613.1 hypothetical protein SAMN04488122_3500 [Chitinophaga arvensicola]
MTSDSSIFDEAFGQPAPVRRRAILPLVLKIYIWFFMVGGVFALLGSFFSIGEFRQQMNTTADPLMVILPIIFIVIYCVCIFLMGWLLWRGVKWALRFNLVIGIFGLIFIGLLLLNFPSGGALSLILPLLLFFTPYFLMLISIRKKWNALNDY